MKKNNFSVVLNKQKKDLLILNLDIPKVPKGYVLGVLPSEKVLSTKFGTYKVIFTKIDDTTFKYNKTIIIKEGIYPKEDYKTYRSFRRSIAKQENVRIAITKK